MKVSELKSPDSTVRFSPALIHKNAVVKIIMLFSVEFGTYIRFDNIVSEFYMKTDE